MFFHDDDDDDKILTNVAIIVTGKSGKSIIYWILFKICLREALHVNISSMWLHKGCIILLAEQLIPLNTCPCYHCGWGNILNNIILIMNKNLFPQVLQVKAVDGDRGINNAIKYSITGGPEHLFGINEDSGLVYSKVRTKWLFKSNSW